MSKFFEFFGFNWFKIIKCNFKNDKFVKIGSNSLYKLVIRKECCSLIFVLLNFLITYFGSIEVYKMSYKSFILFHFLKDNIFVSFIWFVALSILPIVSIFLFKKKIKCKYYLLIDILYLCSNAFNILLVVYFITCFISNVILAVIGIFNIIIAVIINSNIIIKINEFLIH